VPLTVMLIVLAGALLHATWNVLTKSGRDPLIETTLILLGASLLSALVLPFIAFPAPASWPFTAADSVLEFLYFWLLAAAYRLGDMGLTYPLMRGTAPLLVALVSRAVLGERLGLAASCGIVSICAGVLVMALAHRRRGGDWRPVAFALANAAVIATYTIVDGVGVRRSEHPIAYTMAILIAASLVFAPWVAATRLHHVVWVCALGDDPGADRTRSRDAGDIDSVWFVSCPSHIARVAWPGSDCRRIANPSRRRCSASRLRTASRVPCRSEAPG